MKEFRCRKNSASKRVLNTLKAVKLIFRKIIVERVAIIKFGMYKSSGNSASSFVVKRGTDTA
jgi:hypothetical protein